MNSVRMTPYAVAVYIQGFSCIASLLSQSACVLFVKMCAAHALCNNRLQFEKKNGGYCKGVALTSGSYRGFCRKSCYDDAVKLISDEAMATFQTAYSYRYGRGDATALKNLRRSMMRLLFDLRKNAYDQRRGAIFTELTEVYMPQYMERYDCRVLTSYELNIDDTIILNADTLNAQIANISNRANRGQYLTSSLCDLLAHLTYYLLAVLNQFGQGGPAPAPASPTTIDTANVDDSDSDDGYTAESSNAAAVNAAVEATAALTVNDAGEYC